MLKVFHSVKTVGEAIGVKLVLMVLPSE